MKRAVDVLGAGFGLALASPVVGIAALAIKLDDGGPVFYRQRRVGEGERPFTVSVLWLTLSRRRSRSPASIV